MKPHKLAAVVLDQILTEPDAYNQRDWMLNEHGKAIPVNPLDMAGEEPACGTTCCVFGWAVVKTPKKQMRAVVGDVGDSIRSVGRALLGLSYSEGEWLSHQSRTKEQVTAALARLAAGGSIADMVDPW